MSYRETREFFGDLFTLSQSQSSHRERYSSTEYYERIKPRLTCIAAYLLFGEDSELIEPRGANVPEE